jgi:hypothetical protein
MLRCAQHLSRRAARCFAALGMTQCGWSNCQGLFFKIELCLRLYITPTLVTEALHSLGKGGNPK